MFTTSEHRLVECYFFWWKFSMAPSPCHKDLVERSLKGSLRAAKTLPKISLVGRGMWIWTHTIVHIHREFDCSRVHQHTWTISPANSTNTLWKWLDSAAGQRPETPRTHHSAVVFGWKRNGHGLAQLQSGPKPNWKHLGNSKEAPDVKKVCEHWRYEGRNRELLERYVTRFHRHFRPEHACSHCGLSPWQRRNYKILSLSCNL